MVTGIEVTPIAATWAVLDAQLNEIIDCGTYPLFSEDVKVCSSVILDLVSDDWLFLLLADLEVYDVTINLLSLFCLDSQNQRDNTTK